MSSKSEEHRLQAEEYRRKAEDAEASARNADDHFTREAFLEMARTWRRDAEREELQRW